MRHKPDFEIKTRGKVTKYYRCRVCGRESVATSVKEAARLHNIAENADGK